MIFMRVLDWFLVIQRYLKAYLSFDKVGHRTEKIGRYEVGLPLADVFPTT